MTNNRDHRNRGGFTMVELLVVIGLILFLMTISIAALGGAIGIARQKATQATLLKIHGLMQQRIDAFNRAMEKTNRQQAIDKLKKDWFQAYSYIPQDKVLDVMVRKQIFQSRFPQNFAEKNLFLPEPMPNNSSNPDWVAWNARVIKHQLYPETESSALLYWILTNSEVYGIAPVDQGEFSSSEVRDTDGDGLNEFVDAWGRPLRFYRWPTHLFRPGTSSTTAGAIGATTVESTTFAPVDRTYAGVLWSGLPAAPTVAGELDPLSRDPDDPTGQLRRFVSTSTAAMTVVQNQFSTPNTYHAFLIVSAGPDAVLGLEEPFSPTTINATSPALGAVQGRLGALTNYSAIELNPINDNLTNRKR